MVASEDARSVEVHGERLMFFGHLLAGFDDFWDVFVGGVAHEFESQVYLVGLTPVDVTAFMFQITLEALYQCGVFSPNGDRDGEEGSFHADKDTINYRMMNFSVVLSMMRKLILIFQ